MGVTTNEFPLLNSVGLYVANTAGNGNCLFNALSDQLYGDQSKHQDIRDAVIDYMREKADYYKQFIEVHPGGGARRNPKRKNAGSFSTPFNAAGPTAAEIERVFEGHLQQMAQGGTYGDNMEISAFSSKFGVAVKIYQRDFAYVVSAVPEGTEDKVVHIAYHTWEHYSSIRNCAGPHTGVPNVAYTHKSAETEKVSNQKLGQISYVQPWMVNTVLSSLPYLADRATIQKTLEECKGSINNAVSKLLDAEDQSSNSASQGSSSVERDPDSEDEDVISMARKKQDRRLSRATRAVLEKKEEQRRMHELTVRMKKRALPSTKETSSTPEPESLDAVKARDTDETEEEDWQNGSAYKGSTATSASTSASDNNTSAKPRPSGIRLKLSQPKQPDHIVDLSGHKPSDNDKIVDLTSDSQALKSATDKSAVHDNGADGNDYKTINWQPAPKPKRLTARDKHDLKKAAQKSAAKERKKGVAYVVNKSKKDAPFPIQKGKENSSTIETHIKVLYI